MENPADIINLLTYGLREIEVIASGGILGTIDWSEEDGDSVKNEILHKVETTLEEASQHGVDTDHNL